MRIGLGDVLEVEQGHGGGSESFGFMFVSLVSIVDTEALRGDVI